MSTPEMSSRTASLDCLRSIDPEVTVDQAIAVAQVQAIIYLADVLAAAAGHQLGPKQ